MKTTIATVILLTALSPAPIMATDSEQKPATTPAKKLEAHSPRDTSLDFLADIPSLKAVSLKMSEAGFLDIVTQQKLRYERETKGDQTIYYAHAKKGVVVYFGFRQARCTGIQRLCD